MEFVAVLVKDDDFLGPSLIDLTGKNLTDLVGILLEDISLVDVHDPSLKVLPDVQDTPSSERGEGKLLGVNISDLIVIVSGFGLDLFEGDLGVRILNLLDDVEVLVNLAVSLVHIDNHVEVVRRTIGLGDLSQEHVLEYAHHHGPVDVLLFLEVLEGINESDFVFLFHFYLLLSLFLEFNVGFNRVYLPETEFLLMLHSYLFLLSLNGFLPGIAKGNPFLVSLRKDSDNLGTAPEKDDDL